MILKAVPQKKEDEFSLIDDIRQIKRKQQYLTHNEIIFNYPELPKELNKTLLSKSNRVNLFKFTCTCEDYEKKSIKYSGRDIRKACKHIYYKSTQSYYEKYLPKIAYILLKLATFKEIEHLYKVNIFNSDVYFIIQSNSAWIKIISGDNSDNWGEYLFHTVKNRWGYNKIPPNENYIIDQLRKIILNQFPSQHPYKIIAQLKDY